MNYKTARAVLTNYRTALAVLGAAVALFLFRASPHLGVIASKPAASAVSQSAGGSASAGGSISVPGPIVPLAMSSAVYSTHYFRNMNTNATLINGVIGGVTSPESYVDIVNPGTNGATVNSSTSGVGSLCALIYVIDETEKLEECCGCLVAPNQLLEFAVQADLLTNPNYGFPLHNGTIEIIASAPTGTPEYENDNRVCNPGAPNPKPELLAWVTQSRVYPALAAGAAYPGSSATNPTLGVSETPFQFAALSPGEESTLATVCATYNPQLAYHGQCACPTPPLI